MPGIALRFKLEPLEIQQAMDEIRRRMGDLTPAFRIIGGILKASVVRNFDQGGRPVKWPMSVRAEMHGGKTLVKSGKGRDSIEPRAFADRVEIRSTVPYMVAHQLGVDRTVSVAAHMRRARSSGINAGRKDRSKGSGKVRAHQRHMRIPKRAFMAIQEEDRREVRRALIEYITGGNK